MNRRQQIIDFLKGKDWTSPGVIGASVWGIGHHSASASPICIKLVKCGVLERNERGHYRLIKDNENVD